MAEAYCGMRL